MLTNFIFSRRQEPGHSPGQQKAPSLLGSSKSLSNCWNISWIFWHIWMLVVQTNSNVKIRFDIYHLSWNFLCMVGLFIVFSCCVGWIPQSCIDDCIFSASNRYQKIKLFFLIWLPSFDWTYGAEFQIEMCFRSIELTRRKVIIRRKWD